MSKHFILWLFFLANLSLAQTSGSLKEINALSRTNPDSALQLLQPYLVEKNDSLRTSAYQLAGTCWYFKSKYDTAALFFTEAINLFKQRNDEAGLSRAYNGLGLCYYFLSNYEMAFQYHKEALSIREKIQDPQVSSSYNNMGLVLTALGSDNDALKYYKKALQAKIQFKQFLTLSTTLTNIAGIYRDDNRSLDSALLYDMKNLRHLDSIPDDRNLATCYNNIGLTYQAMNDFKRAEQSLSTAFRLEKKLGRGFEITNVCHNLALVWIKLGNPIKADRYLDSAFLLVKNISEYRPIRTIYLMQARVDSLMGNKALAYGHLRDYVDAQAKFDSIERENLTLELEKKYQAELKEQQITELQQVNTIKDLEADSARQRQIFMIVGLVLLVVSVLVLYNRYQLKQRTAKALDEKNTELQKLNGFKDKMFAVISHDLRNPVDAFSTLMESLTQNLQHASQAELKEYLQSTLDSAKDLKSLLNNLLEWSLVQIGKLPFNPKAFSIGQVIQESVQHVSAMALAKNISIEYAHEEAAVLADRSMIVIILRNLLSNAIKFSTVGKPVRISFVRQSGHLSIHVQDEGIGMKPEDAAKLFKSDVNARTIGSSPEKGAGIGLMLCKELADKNNGKIYVESAEGKGSTFYLELPLA